MLLRYTLESKKRPEVGSALIILVRRRWIPPPKVNGIWGILPAHRIIETTIGVLVNESQLPFFLGHEANRDNSKVV